LGLIWDILPSTTLRAAAFSTVKRPFAASQTVEPTQVAGFNQFFDDVDGTKTRRYGVGIDHTLSADLFGGIELSWRDLEVPILQLNFDERTLAFNLEDEEEQLHRAYLYWTPAPRWAFSAEAQREQFERTDEVGDTLRPTALTTHRIPLVANYYHPNGLFARFGATYVDQDVDSLAGGESEGEENFWTADATGGYRLPNRLGIAELSVRNVFNEDFRFEDTNFQLGEPRISILQPERQIFVRLIVSF